MRSEMPPTDPFAGRYLFHLHTTYTDGSVTVPEYCELGRRLGLDRLVFLEHIRRVPTYDVERFVAEVREGGARCGPPALVGFEAKLLPGGELDIRPEHLALADVVGIAEHGFPPDFALWRSSVERGLEGAAAAGGGRPVVWVHPGLWLKRNGLLAAREGDLLQLAGRARALGIRLERNLRYGLLPPHLLAAVASDQWVLGADAHRLEEAAAAVAHLPATR